VIAAYSRSPLAFHVMAMPQGPKTIEDLKGRKVAGPKGTTLNQLLVAALVSKGLTLADVSYINMDLPAARAALLAGTVDAATLAGNHSLAVEAAKGHVIASGAGLIEPTAVIAVRSAFLRDHPKLVEAYLAVHRQALDYMAKEPDAALAMAAAEQKISLDDARKMMAWYDFAPTMTDRDVANLEGDMAFMLENKLLTQRIDIRRDLVHKMAFAP
jgi:sulfonate transport system substrate-binding protein